MSEAIIDYAFWFHDRMRIRSATRFERVLRVSNRQKSLQHACLTAGLWIGFFTGALYGAAGERRFALLSLLGPMGVVAVVAVVGIVRPIAAADEPPAEQSAH